jgi:hypothetical protein
MALISCPECNHKLSDKAFACPGCGYPAAAAGPARNNGLAGVAGGVAGTWISASAIQTVIVGSVAFISFAAIMITIIVVNG